jgi:hypothetical protein
MSSSFHSLDSIRIVENSDLRTDIVFQLAALPTMSGLCKKLDVHCDVVDV